MTRMFEKTRMADPAREAKRGRVNKGPKKAEKT